MRETAYGTGYDLVMLIFGEFNVFTSEDARRILEKAHAALKPGGRLLLEPHTFAAIRRLGKVPSTWYSAETGLFSPEPHLVLAEAFWDETLHVATERFFIIDAETGTVTRHAASMQAYSDADYVQLLMSTGFEEITFYPSLTGEAEEFSKDLLALTARKAAEDGA